MKTIGIMGGTGSAKSSFVNLISRLYDIEPPADENTESYLLVGGKDVKSYDLDTLRQEVSVVLQKNVLFSGSILDNLRWGDPNATEEECIRACKLACADEFIEKMPDKYNTHIEQGGANVSGGQKQRVAIARALASNPKILLCDEATSALDPQTTKSILKLLKRVNEELGITIVLITHEMAVIKEICDRVAVMENGYVVEEGSIIDIFSKPQAEVTRNFIASTSNAHRVQEMLDAGASVTRLEKGQRMVKLNYDSVSTSKALISEISRQFLVDTNIIFGNVEIIKNTPLGDLIVILSGEEAHIDQALAYLKAHEVGVEVMKSC